jgi:hypothetical protein
VTLLSDFGDFCLWASSLLIVVWVVQYSVLARWWRHFIGITIVGLALCLLAIYIPNLLFLADPSDFGNFATTRWYQILAACIVGATTVFLATRIATWEFIRRQRQELLPSQMLARITELEAQLAECRAAQEA